MPNLLVAIDPAALGPRPGKTGWAVFDGKELKGSGSCKGRSTMSIWAEVSRYFIGRPTAQRRLVVEEPGGWIRGFAGKGGRHISYDAIRALERAIGAWQEHGAETVTDEHVKEAITGDRHAKKSLVHKHLQIMGYQIAPGTCADCRPLYYEYDHDPDAADAVALGHVVSSEASHEG